MKHTTYTTIETVDGRYKLSALWYYKENRFSVISLKVPKTIDKNNHWDSSWYILYVVYPFLKDKKVNYTIDDSYKLIPKKDRKELKGIIKQGIKLGFFKDTIKEQNESNT